MSAKASPALSSVKSITAPVRSSKTAMMRRNSFRDPVNVVCLLPAVDATAYLTAATSGPAPIGLSVETGRSRGLPPEQPSVRRPEGASATGGRLTKPTPALAAPNPAGTGQPGAEFGEEGATMEPAGFLTAGCAHAETVYAGSDGTPSLANGSSHAVSQYDIACYQVTSNH
jgi:hypothetical protein